ncbi:hypothetical protein BH10PLA2_BH10PLA2_06570 [soil metagenome]
MTQPGRIRAPRKHGAIESVPPISQLPAGVAANRTLLLYGGCPVLGRNWLDLRKEAGRAALEAAVAYQQRVGQPVPPLKSTSIVMAGHQPELFHPGVWVKNFALNGLAQATQAIPLNLVVDNDTVKSTSIRLPVQTEQTESKLARVIQIPFDERTSETPYEEYEVRDEELFRSLPERVAAHTSGWGFEPFLNTLWKELVSQGERVKLLGERIAATRRKFERDWGCTNLEIPVSDLNRTEPFAWFACDVLDRLPEFRLHYNQSVEDYRQQYGIRSRSHPVPNLALEGEWIEAPFWSWEHGQTRRGRLYARLTPDRIELRSDAAEWPSLPRPQGADGQATVKAYQDLNRRGLQIRSRALSNTLYCRLFVGDYFLHGIGGGKYDEVTDALARAFYRIQPPSYGVLTATLLLPLQHWHASTQAVHELERRVRDLEYNPERFFGDEQQFNELALRLMERKKKLVAEEPSSHPAKKQRFLDLRDVNARLAAFVIRDREHAVGLLEDSRHEVTANAILDSRDYSFCLYPATLLREFMTRFLAG